MSNVCGSWMTPMLKFTVFPIQLAASGRSIQHFETKPNHVVVIFPSSLHYGRFYTHQFTTMDHRAIAAKDYHRGHTWLRWASYTPTDQSTIKHDKHIYILVAPIPLTHGICHTLKSHPHKKWPNDIPDPHHILILVITNPFKINKLGDQPPTKVLPTPD